MEWLERMDRAIDYIEDNQTGEIELGEAARMCRRSPNVLAGGGPV